MRTVFCRLLKMPAIGSDIRICYRDKYRGGLTEASYVVARTDHWKPLPDGEDVGGRETWTYQPEPDYAPQTWVKCTEAEGLAKLAESLALRMTLYWGGEMFSSRARKGGEVIITCQGDNQVFFPMFNGTEAAGAEYIEIDQ